MTTKWYQACSVLYSLRQQRTISGSLLTMLTSSCLYHCLYLCGLFGCRNAHCKEKKGLWLNWVAVLQALLPEKRYLFYPNLAKAAGSVPLAQRLRALTPDVHVFGHTHFSWDADIEGVQSGCLQPDAQSLCECPQAMVLADVPLQ